MVQQTDSDLGQPSNWSHPGQAGPRSSESKESFVFRHDRLLRWRDLREVTASVSQRGYVKIEAATMYHKFVMQLSHSDLPFSIEGLCKYPGISEIGTQRMNFEGWFFLLYSTPDGEFAYILPIRISEVQLGCACKVPKAAIQVGADLYYPGYVRVLHTESSLSSFLISHIFSSTNTTLRFVSVFAIWIPPFTPRPHGVFPL